MPIGPAVAELSSRDGTHVCPILTFLTISSCIFPMLKQRGNRRFSSACHAFIFYPNDPVSRRRSSSIRSLQNVQISAGYRQRFGLGMTPKDPQDPKVKQTDIPFQSRSCICNHIRHPSNGMRHVLQDHPLESVPVSHAVEGMGIPSKENRLSIGRLLPEI